MTADRHIYTLPIGRVMYLVVPAGMAPSKFTQGMQSKFRQAFYATFPLNDEILNRKDLVVVSRLPEDLPPRTLIFRWFNPAFAGSRYDRNNPYHVGYSIDKNDKAWRAAIIDKWARHNSLARNEVYFRFTWSPRGLPESEDDPFADTDSEMADVIVKQNGHDRKVKPLRPAPFQVTFACEREAAA